VTDPRAREPNDVDVVVGLDAAFDQAERGLRAGELPIGAAVVVDGRVLAASGTQERAQERLLVHAELLALDEADHRPSWDRRASVLVTTLEPCLLCLAAAGTAMVGRVAYAQRSPTDGSADVAAWWSDHRQAGLGHVQLPEVLAVPSASERSAGLFARYVADRSTAPGGASDDGLIAWARLLAAPLPAPPA
jgi:tRNA(adenine34) deaminase